MSRVQVRALRPYEGQKLVRWLRQGKDAIAVRRAEIVLRSAQGDRASEIARALHFSADYVRKVIHGFNEQGLECLKAQYENGGRPVKVLPEQESCLVELALTPPNLIGLPFTHWSLQRLTEVAIGRKVIPRVSLETVRQILKRHRLSLQRTRTWKQSTDPQFEVKKTQSRGCIGRHGRGAYPLSAWMNSGPWNYGRMVAGHGNGRGIPRVCGPHTRARRVFATSLRRTRWEQENCGEESNSASGRKIFWSS